MSDHCLWVAMVVPIVIPRRIHEPFVYKQLYYSLKYDLQLRTQQERLINIKLYLSVENLFTTFFIETKKISKKEILYTTVLTEYTYKTKDKQTQ